MLAYNIQMSFITDNLSEGEEVRIYAKIHPIIFYDTIVWLLLSIMLIAYGNFYVEASSGLIRYLSIGLLLIAFIRLCKAGIYKYSTEVAVTNKRIIAKFGLIEREVIELPLMKIESVIIDQSVLERVLGSGSVGVRGTGTGMAPVRYIDNPLEFRNALNEAIAEARGSYQKEI